MFGSVGEWMYQSLGGLNPGAPAFRKVIVKPQPAGDLEWVNCDFMSVNGMIRSNWKREGGAFVLNVDIPVNCTAEVWIPSAKQARITEGGRPVADIPGIKELGFSNGYTLIDVGSGSYSFRAE